MPAAPPTRENVPCRNDTTWAEYAPGEDDDEAPTPRLSSTNIKNVGGITVIVALTTDDKFKNKKLIK